MQYYLIGACDETGKEAPVAGAARMGHFEMRRGIKRHNRFISGSATPHDEGNWRIIKNQAIKLFSG